MRINPKLLIPALCLLSACRGDVLPDEPSVLISLQVNRAGGDPLTYRALLYTLPTADDFYTWGTYRDPDSGDPDQFLTPCAVNDNTGAPTAGGTKDTYYGMYPAGATYYLVLITPAVKPATISTGKTGYKQKRVPDAGDPVLMFSKPIAVSVSGIAFGGNYIYTIPQANMPAPRRANITFKFSCGDDIDDITLKTLAVNNLIKEGWYLPQAARFEPVTTEDVTVFTGTKTLKKGEAPYEFGTVDILPMDYSAIGDDGKPLYTVPVMVFTKGEAVIQYPLLFNYEPMHKYTYNFIVNSYSIVPHLTVEPWQTGSTTGVNTNSTQLVETTLPAISLEGWQNGGGGTDTFGN
ncbi:MAG: hypothetical protein LBU44_02630 [Mediterranea sp.]|jgi:hypothetical protein|nr:hypothetical protein [Mediterranea sp.]